MGNFKKMLFGEKMPDKNDPNYKERYEKEVDAGRRFARFTRIDRLAACIQKFASRHSKMFLAIVFGFVIGCFALNMYNLARAYSSQTERKSATEQQEQKLRKIIKSTHNIIPIHHGTTEED